MIWSQHCRGGDARAQGTVEQQGRRGSHRPRPRQGPGGSQSSVRGAARNMALEAEDMLQQTGRSWGVGGESPQPAARLEQPHEEPDRKTI